MTSGVEIGNQFAVARQMGGRFPSEIAGVSSREFGRLEDVLHEEAQRAEEAQREARREAWLRQA